MFFISLFSVSVNIVLFFLWRESEFKWQFWHNLYTLSDKENHKLRVKNHELKVKNVS